MDLIMVKAILQKVVLYGSTAVPIILVRWISMEVLNVGGEMMSVKQKFRKAVLGTGVALVAFANDMKDAMWKEDAF